MTIRPLASPADYAAAVRLQQATWGRGEAVPASLLKVSNKIGGIAAGAFDERGRLLGFVYGLTGVRDGRLVHWSHMLAVRPRARDQGVGRALKEFQRARLVERGVEAMLWTFDPLVAKNAYLNLQRLGARVDEYVLDMYPHSESPLHSFGTDRLIVHWDLRPDPATRRPGDPATAATVQVEIPEDIHAVAAQSLEQARAWRQRTREQFLDLLGRGYAVTRFERGPDGRRAYLLAPAPQPERE